MFCIVIIYCFIFKTTHIQNHGNTSKHQRATWPGLYRQLIDFLRIVVWHMRVSARLLEVTWLECAYSSLDKCVLRAMLKSMYAFKWPDDPSTLFGVSSDHSLQEALFSGQTESPPSNYYIGGSTCIMTSMCTVWSDSEWTVISKCCPMTGCNPHLEPPYGSCGV